MQHAHALRSRPAAPPATCPALYSPPWPPHYPRHGFSLRTTAAEHPHTYALHSGRSGACYLRKCSRLRRFVLTRRAACAGRRAGRRVTRLLQLPAGLRRAPRGTIRGNRKSCGACRAHFAFFLTRKGKSRDESRQERRICMAMTAQVRLCCRDTSKWLPEPRWAPQARRASSRWRKGSGGQQARKAFRTPPGLGPGAAWRGQMRCVPDN